MRRRRLLARAMAVAAATLLSLFGALQTGAGQRLLFDAIASIASTPQRSVRIEGPSGFFPTNLALARVELADTKGVWLSAHGVRVAWSFAALLGGRLEIDTLHAVRLEIVRAPQTTASSTSQPSASAQDGDPLPLPISVASLVIDELRLGTALTGIDSRWRVEASARLDGLAGGNSLSVSGTRSDGKPGRLMVRASYDGAREAINAEGDFEEGDAGVLAALLGRPDLPRTSGTFKIEGTRAGGEARLSLEAGDALRVNGSGRLRPGEKGRQLALTVDVQGGRIPDPMWAAALARPARIEADILLEPSGAIEGRTLRITSAPLEAIATGRYVPADKRLQLRLTASGGDPAMLAAIVPGARWRDARINLQAEGTLAAMNATASLGAAELSAIDVSAKSIDLTVAVRGADMRTPSSMRGEVTGGLEAIAWRTAGGEITARDLRITAMGERTAGGALAIRSFDLTSSLLTAAGSGTVDARGAIAGTATLAVPDLSALNAVAGWPIAGAAQLNARLSGTLDQPGVALDATVRDAVVASVPPAFVGPAVRLTARGTVDRQLGWRLDAASVASDAVSVEGRGAGRGATGAVDVTVRVPTLTALDPRHAGDLRGDVRIDATDMSRTVRLKARLAHARLDGTAVERLDLDSTVTLRPDGWDGTLQLDGASGDRPLRAQGRVAATAGARLSIPSFEASLGKTNLSIRDLAIDRVSATGSARLVIEDLQEIGALIDQKTAGRLELTVVPDPAASDGRLKASVRGTNLALGETGAATLNADATIADPLGRTAFDATLAASGLRGVADIRTLSLTASGDRTAIAATAEASGPAMRADGAVKAGFAGDQTVIDISGFKAVRDGRAMTLAQPARIRQVGQRTVVEPLRLALAGGQVRVAGAVDRNDSDLTIDIAGLPLAEVAALAGWDQQPAGALQAQLRVRGARGNPEIDATYTVRDARLRGIATASLPAMALAGKGALRNRDLTAEARLTAGASNLTLSASGRLPSPGGAPTGRLTLKGPVELAMFASLLGPDIQQVAGRALVDATIDERGGRPRGSGTVRLEGVGLAVPSEGLVLSQGAGLLRLAEDRIVVERLAFPAVGKGDVSISGEVRLDPALSWPLDLRLETRNARLVNRRDLVAEATASLRLYGSVAEGLSLQGPIRIDRADISAAVGGAAKAVPAVPVREIGAGAPKRATTPAPAKPLALDLKVSAARAVFVRGKGLDAELAGDFAITGTSANPSVTGGLRMRRGTYTVLGRPLRFSRGNVTFTNADRIVPLLDLVAATRNGATAIEITVGGPASEPKIVLSSTPQLPQDEIMARFLFGKGAAELGPSQLVQVAEALAELTGSGSSPSAIDSVRRALGLDRLGLGQGDPGAQAGNGVGGTGVEGGRYIGQGIYVGGRQGLQGDSRGVVQIEVIPHVKIEAEVGTNSTGRAGIALEYDY